MNEATGKDVANKVGSFMEFEQEEGGEAWGRYLKVRVLLDIRKPLCRCVRMTMLNGKEKKIQLQYERLPPFCYACGIIGHGEKECIIMDRHAKQEWGNFARAPIDGRAKLGWIGDQMVEEKQDEVETHMEGRTLDLYYKGTQEPEIINVVEEAIKKKKEVLEETSTGKENMLNNEYNFKKEIVQKDQNTRVANPVVQTSMKNLLRDLDGGKKISMHENHREQNNELEGALVMGVDEKEQSRVGELPGTETKGHEHIYPMGT